MQKAAGSRAIFLVYTSFATFCSMIALGAMLLSPSEPGSAVLLGLSPARPVLAMGFLAGFLFFALLFWKAFRDPDWANRAVEQWFGAGPFSRALAWFAGIGFGLGWLGCFLPSYRAGILAPHWDRIQPLAILLLIVSAAISFYIVAVKWPSDLAHDVAAGVQSFFNFTPRTMVQENVVIEQQTPITELATDSRSVFVDYTWAHTWMGSTKTLQVTDEVLPVREGSSAGKSLACDLHWLLPDWKWEVEPAVEAEGQGWSISLASPFGRLILILSTVCLPRSASTPGQLSLVIDRAGERVFGAGDAEPYAGWTSPSYGDKISALSLTASLTVPAPFKLTSRLIFA